MTAPKHPKPIPVPRLRQKLWALYMVAGLDDRKLAERFGLTGKAIRNWVAGDGSREPEHVPARHFQRLTEIFREHMPQRPTLGEVRGWLRAPSQESLIRALLSEAPAVDWMTLVLSAGPSQATVIRAGAQRQATLRRDPLQALQPACEVPVGQLFRLLLQIPSAGWLCIVQWGRGGWLGLELADGQAVRPVEAGEELLPPTPPYFQESEPGNRRYIFMQAAQAFPPDVAVTLLHSALTAAPLHADTLARLAHVAGVHAVELKSLDVAFTDPAEPGE